MADTLTFSALPYDVLRNITTHLTDPVSFGALAQSCRTGHRLISDVGALPGSCESYDTIRFNLIGHTVTFGKGKGITGVIDTDIGATAEFLRFYARLTRQVSITMSISQQFPWDALEGKEVELMLVGEANRLREEDASPCRLPSPQWTTGLARANFTLKALFSTPDALCWLALHNVSPVEWITHSVIELYPEIVYHNITDPDVIRKATRCIDKLVVDEVEEAFAIVDLFKTTGTINVKSMRILNPFFVHLPFTIPSLTHLTIPISVSTTSLSPVLPIESRLDGICAPRLRYLRIDVTIHSWNLSDTVVILSDSLRHFYPSLESFDLRIFQLSASPPISTVSFLGSRAGWADVNVSNNVRSNTDTGRGRRFRKLGVHIRWEGGGDGDPLHLD